MFQAKQQQAQNNFLLDRDQAKFDQQQQQQRKADFDAARNRIDTHAKDMLANGEITDPEARQRIQNLIAGKTIVMGSDFDETARQNYLDQYNAELAKILSEVPPAKPEPPPQPNFHTDQNGNQWVEAGPGKWEQVPRQENKPTTMQEYYNANEDKLQGDLDAKMQSMQDEVYAGKSTGPVTRQAAWEQMKKDWEFRQKVLGRSAPPPDLSGFGTSSAAYYNAPDSEANSQAGMPIASPDPGRLPSPVQSPAASGMPIQPPDAGQPPSPQQDALPLVSNSRSQNPLAEMAAMDNGQQAAPPAAVQQPATVQGGLPKVAPPDFGKLMGSAPSDEDKAFFSQVETLYKGQSPDVQAAISVFLSPNSLDEEFIAARDYLKAAGIDMKQLAAESPKTVREKVQGKMRAKYGENYDSF